MSQWAQALGSLKDLSTGGAKTRPRACPVPVPAATHTRLNPQQEALVACTHPRLRVTALAGTGKTTAMVEYARHRSCKNALYLAFNRSMAQQAQEAFGPRVKCKTVHSLAWGAYGRPIEHKMGLAPDVQALMKALDLPDCDLGLAFCDVLLVSLDRFIKSDHPRACRHDIAAQPWATLKSMDVNRMLPGIDDAVEMVHKLWALAQDPSDMRVGATHDLTIKRAHLAGAPIKSDLIMVDEAQDLTPAMACWIHAQKSGIIVFAGDPYQEMYSWRQPKPLEWGFPGEHGMALTYSHRFGPELEPIVNPVLKALGSEHEIRAVGGSTRILVDEEIQGRHFVLGRTRARLSEYAAKAMEQGLAVAWPGANKEPPPSFDAWDRLSDEYGQDDWLLDEYVPDKSGFVDVDQADVILSTVHQAKGQTYERVKVLEDVFDRDNALERGELCVRYVALTRATREISLPACALDFNPMPASAPGDKDNLSGDGFS